MKSALVVTNLQTDFFTGGKQPIPNSEQILNPINQLIEKVCKMDGLVIFIRDWHPPYARFFRNIGEHCIANSPGATFPKTLNLAIGHALTLNNGLDLQEHVVSAFNATDTFFNLEHYLDTFNLKNIFLVGLTLESQIQQTALDGIDKGYDVTVVSDAVKAATVVGFKETPDVLQQKGVKLISTKEALKLIGKKSK
jgi:nicotinamidase/pyrazinamidase